MNSIIVHDHLFVRGGAEGVVLKLLDGLTIDKLCVGFCADDSLRTQLTEQGIEITSLGRPIRHPAIQYLLGGSRFKNHTGFLKDFDLVFYSGGIAPLAVNNQHRGKRVLYCHALPRFAYDLQDYWLRHAKWWQYPLLRLLAVKVRADFANAIGQMDLVIANSENVRARLLNYLEIESVVVHPPCDIKGYSWEAQGDYYLSTARLEGFKRVSYIVNAFKAMPDKRLVIASEGSEIAELKQLAGGASNIEFTGWVSDSELRNLVANAIATIYVPIDEDFGISPVESMAAGKPVVGVAEGGMLETVVHGQTGYLIDGNLSIEKLIDAVSRLTPEDALRMRHQCEKRAQQFSEEKFITNIENAIRECPDRNIIDSQAP